MKAPQQTEGRLGFWSGFGVLAAGISVVLILGWTVVAGATMFNPGLLNAHATGRQLGGVSTHAQLADNCEACHTPPWSSQTMGKQCDACHSDVEKQVVSHRGLHARVAGTASVPHCSGCHTDHRGANASLTSFEHDQVGFALTGAHRNAPCHLCHKSAETTGDFGDAPRACFGCHKKDDEHNGDFGPLCGACHSTVAWTGARVDHSKVGFPLTGAHRTTRCSGCHGTAQTAAQFRSAPHECIGCHAKDDPHNRSFGDKCDECHNTTSWDDAQFEHTIFPTNHGAEERKPTCKTCHPTEVSKYTCYGCHEHTPTNVVGQHEGKSAAAISDCIRCHKGGRGGGD